MVKKKKDSMGKIRYLERKVTGHGALSRAKSTVLVDHEFKFPECSRFP